MVNYEVDPGLLRAHVPRGVELDDWNGRTFVSLVGFLFKDTRVRGIPFPFHRDFEEVNLRYYVRRKGPDGWRRGVVFIREIVPRPAIAWIAKLAYNEPYLARPMRHLVSATSVEYAWRMAGAWQSVRLARSGAPQPITDGSQAEFITEHYWGYCRQTDGSTLEYEVEHPRWLYWQADAGLEISCNFCGIYGENWETALSRPVSAFIAEGSEVVVHRPLKLT